MKQFFAFVKKEFYHILRDRRTMLIVLGIPIVEIILFGFAISTEVKNVRVTILDPSSATQRPQKISKRDSRAIRSTWGSFSRNGSMKRCCIPVKRMCR